MNDYIVLDGIFFNKNIEEDMILMCEMLSALMGRINCGVFIIPSNKYNI